MDHDQQPRDDHHHNPYGPPGASPYGPPGASPYGAYGQPLHQSPYGGAPQPGYGTASRRPGIIPLVPLTLGDVLGGSFAAIRRNAAAVVGTALLVALVEVVLMVFAASAFFDSMFELVMLEESGVDPFAGTFASEGFLGRFFGSLGALLLAGLVTVFTSVIAHGVLSVVVLRAAAGLRTSLAQAWRLTGRQVWSLAGLGALYLVAGALATLVFLGVLFALLAAAIGGDETTTAVLGVLVAVLSVGLGVASVWLYVKFLLAPAAVAVEEQAPFRSLGRSWSLTRGHWWRTFGIVLLVGIIVGVVSSVITTPLSMAGGMTTPFLDTESAEQVLAASRTWLVVSLVVSALVNALTRAYLSCVTALLYVDYRIRHEGFDLELGAAADQAGLGDDDRFSTVRDVPSGTGTEDLVPGRRRAGTPGAA